MPHRKIHRAKLDDVANPPPSLPSRYDAHKPRSQVSVLATPIFGSSLPSCVDRLRPRCQNRSLCCQATQKRNPGSKRKVSTSPANIVLPMSIARARSATRQVTRRHDCKSERLARAVWQDMSQERWKKLAQARKRKRRWRRVVSRSTTNVCSVLCCIMQCILKADCYQACLLPLSAGATILEHDEKVN